MDIGLNPSRPRPAATRRIAAFLALVALVALAHAWLTRTLVERMAERQAAAAMPKRIEVAYVRTLDLERPKAAVAAASPPPAPRASRAPRRVSAPASAPRPEPELEAESPSAAQAPDPSRPEAVAEGPSEAASVPGAAVASASPAASEPASEPTRMGAGDAASAPPGEGFVWPTATRVTYLLKGYWRGDLDGRAEVEWIRVGDRYQVNVSLFAGPEFAPIFSRRMTSEGSVGAGGLVPDRYDEDTQVLFRDRRRVSVAFLPDAVVLANGTQREREPGVQDTASQFIQFTWLFGSQPERLRVGNSFELPLALPRSLRRWTYDVAGEETVATPFGPLATFNLKPRRAVRQPGEWLVEMWFAPELRYLPVKVHIEQDAGSWVDLTIAKKPEISGS